MDDWLQLIHGLGRRIGPEPERIAGIAYDSRRVEPGFCFIAVPGFRVDGHDFIPDAVARGARALVVQREDAVPEGMAAVVVEDARAAMARLAARFYDHPSRELGLVGVTGTNGKTTTTYMSRAVLETAGPTGLIGTVQSIVGRQAQPAERTTPEAPDLNRMLRAMRVAGDRFAVMEVSSEGLALHRADGLDFNVAVFTNLTQDHLNFHGTMEAYFEAKAKLFDMLAQVPEGGHGGGPRGAVINVDDAYGRRLAERCRVPLVTYGVEREADIRAVDVEAGGDGLAFTLTFPGGTLPVRLRVGGRFNVYNALAAFGVGWVFGIEPERAVAALARVEGAPGRFEHVRAGQPFTVVVDYAHSPDGIENVLRAAREVTRGRVIAVFGAGGDRDRTKRPLMGAAGARLADVVVLTSDNPRSEDPERILDDIAAGANEAAARSGARVLREVDRRAAIRLAFEQAQPGDIVVIAGKGHETYQIFRDRTIHFDDREVALEELRAMGYGEGGQGR
ncbi:MAG: UDP-N-acetylmuramoyl-L-alanyl-D-glutamate--2,6-diaminopimelate ligase [Clostridia bacterium]|nr:UDP-N-acetylmuramoyl-L-alanyl-D-glutamate--2,6-diaminopimelate ligase [Clostridia bacterium]